MFSIIWIPIIISYNKENILNKNNFQKQGSENMIRLHLERWGIYSLKDKILAALLGLLIFALSILFFYYFILLFGFILKLVVVISFIAIFLLFFKEFIPVLVVLSPLIFLFWLLILIF